MLCAHLFHPAMVNDDLTGVVVGIDAMRTLLDGPRPRYTYRLLIVPDLIARSGDRSRPTTEDDQGTHAVCVQRRESDRGRRPW